MSNRGSNIPRDREDEKILEMATEKVSVDIRNKYLTKIPSNWDIKCGSKRLIFSFIKEALINNGFSSKQAESYYGCGNYIETDGYIIYIEFFQNGKYITKPLFMGEMKKQGTNGKRISEGKTKQAQGNAAGDRVAKNYFIASDYCYLCDNEFFPYNVYLHGFDFSEEEITSTTKSKLAPFFGELNKFNPWFDQDVLRVMSTHKGGSCFYQEEDFTFEQLYKMCYDCCEIGIKHYLKKYGSSK